MKKLIAQLIIDSFLWILIYLSIFKNIVWAQNVLMFFVVTFGSLGLLALFYPTEKLKESLKPENHTGNLVRYIATSASILEIIVFASQGWFFMATLWVGLALFTVVTRKAYDEKFGKKKGWL